MDRIGCFALAASLVLVSALHMLNAPNYLNVIPAVVFVFGLARLVMVRPEATPESDFPMTHPIEG